MEELKDGENRAVDGKIVAGSCVNVLAMIEDYSNRCVRQIARHPLKEVSAIYDRGVRLSPNQYEVDLQRARLTLRDPPVGKVTCDVKGPDMGEIPWPNCELSDCWRSSERSEEIVLVKGLAEIMPTEPPFTALEDPTAAQQKNPPFKEAEVQCMTCKYKSWVPWDKHHSSQCSACQSKATYTGYGK